MLLLELVLLLELELVELEVLEAEVTLVVSPLDPIPLTAPLEAPLLLSPELLEPLETEAEVAALELVDAADAAVPEEPAVLEVDGDRGGTELPQAASSSNNKLG